MYRLEHAETKYRYISPQLLFIKKARELKKYVGDYWIGHMGQITICFIFPIMHLNKKSGEELGN